MSKRKLTAIEANFQTLIDAEMHVWQLASHNMWKLRERLCEWRKEQSEGLSAIYGATIFMYIDPIEEQLKTLRLLSDQIDLIADKLPATAKVRAERKSRKRSK